MDKIYYLKKLSKFAMNFKEKKWLKFIHRKEFPYHEY